MRLPALVASVLIAGGGVALGSPLRHLTIDAGGGDRLAFDAALVVDVQTRVPLAHAISRAAWRQDGDQWIEDVSGPGFAGALRIGPSAEGIAVEAEIHYTAPATVAREAIELRLPGHARALGRDLRVARLASPLRIDRGTPIWLETAPAPHAAGAALIGQRGLHAARYAPLEGETEVELVIDDPASHPFSSYAKCRASYLPHQLGMPPLRRPPPELERRAPHAHITRAAGAVVRARAVLVPLHAGQGFTPVIAERWPAGARAAVVVTDHADRTDPLALRAVLYGVSDPTDPAYRKGGFFGHRLKITKTFFASPGIGSLADPDARALADEIVAAGSEVGAHSITPRRDTRTVVAHALASFAPWHAATWIDHQPDTNCEAITNFGWRDDPRFGIHDLLVQAGFSWVWGATDASEQVRLRNLFEPERRAAAIPPIYPLPGDPRLWVFISTWFYGTPERLAQAVSDTALDQLEHERGLFVAHTYLSASARTTLRRRDLVHRDVVIPRVAGGFALHPLFERALARVGARVERGDIASMTVREAADRLRALDGVIVRYRSDGAAIIHNDGTAAIRGLTIAVPRDVTLSVDGASPEGRRTEAARATAWFELPAGASVEIRASSGGAPVRLGRAGAPAGEPAP